ncbi:MAG: hypothetical protein ACRD8W_10740, partial [Nitrososphaeraceae archaeon]
PSDQLNPTISIDKIRPNGDFLILTLYYLRHGSLVLKNLLLKLHKMRILKSQSRKHNVYVYLSDLFARPKIPPSRHVQEKIGAFAD